MLVIMVTSQALHPVSLTAPLLNLSGVITLISAMRGQNVSSELCLFLILSCWSESRLDSAVTHYHLLKYKLQDRTGQG